MPGKENKQPPSKPKCTLSSWRLLEQLETVPLQDVPSSKQVNEPDPSESGSCGCDEDVSAPVTWCALDPQREISSRSSPAQELKNQPVYETAQKPTCVSNSHAIEVEAMIDEIRICREIIRKLALEAIDILHPENSQQYKQNLKPQQEPIANPKVSCCELYDDSEANPIEPASQAKPIDLRQKSDCTKKKCEISETIKYSGSEGQSTTRLYPIPPTLPKSPALSRKSSGPIAQTACQIKDKRLGQNVVRKKSSNCGCEGGKKKKADCSCDDKSESKTDCKTFILKTFGMKPNNYCDGEKNQNLGCSCDETMNKNTLGKKPSNCGCDNREKKQNINCNCDETMMKQNKENEKRENKTDSMSCLQNTFGCMSRDTAPVVIDDCVCDDEEMKKQNRANCLKEKRKAASVAAASVAAACTRPKCAANTCTCHFPPAYSQYFECTGHVSGNCHCDKNA